MADLEIRDVLQESLFGQLPATLLDELVDSARTIEVPAGKLIYDPQLSVIVEGTMRAFVDDGSGRHLTVSYMRRPQSLGVAIAAGQESPVAFQAITASRVLRLPYAQFHELLQAHPEIGWEVSKELARYLDDILTEIARVAFQPLRARVAYHLLALAECQPGFHRSVHQAELAAAVGSVREVVGRTIASLRDAGVVDVSQAGITVVNFDGLRQVAHQRE